MMRAVVAILLGVSLSRAGPAQISVSTQAADEVFTVDLSNEPRNAGRPLGDADFTTSERAVIAQGIADVEAASCLRFVERNGESDYVQIHPGDGGCYAVIPYRIGGGMREVGLQQSGCVYTKIVIHELLHVV